MVNVELQTLLEMTVMNTSGLEQRFFQSGAMQTSLPVKLLLSTENISPINFRLHVRCMGGAPALILNASMESQKVY